MTDSPVPKQSTTKLRSREYPAVSLKKAVEIARRIFEKDRFTVAPADATARLLGYSGVNGASRALLSALKKYGLLTYHGSGSDFQVGLSDLSKALFLGTEEGHEHALLTEAMRKPTLLAELLDRFSPSELPSDETLSKVLERDFGLQSKAIPDFIRDFKETLEYVKSFAPAAPPSVVDRHPEGHQPTTESTSETTQGRAGTLRLPMPGGPAYIVIPDPVTASDARRIKTWLDKVVGPTLDFAASEDDAE